ncbi:hypothetical protein GCM10022270_29090 [Terriglobus aquaticus]
MLGLSPLATAQASKVTPIAQCVEYANTPDDAQVIAHFTYFNAGSAPVAYRPDGSSNYFQPLDITTQPLTYYPGFHPDAVLISVPFATAETWHLGTSESTVYARGAANFSGPITPTCPVRLIPAALQLTQPGTYTHRFLGQVESGPPADAASVLTEAAIPPGGAGVSISNLTYVAGDSSNPSHSLNPNSLYGDVTLTTAQAGTTYVKLQMHLNGAIVTKALLPVTILAPIAPALALTIVDHQFDDAPFTLAASSNSPGAITYNIVSGPAAVTGNVLTLTGAGPVTVAANQAASGSYAAASSAATFQVQKGPASISLSGLTEPYTGRAVNPNASTTPAGLTVAFNYAGSSSAPTQPGSYPFTASVVDANYQGSISAVLVISPPVTGTVQLVSQNTLRRAADGSLLLTVSLVNSGTGTAQNVTVTSLSVNGISGLVPVSFGSIPPKGGSASQTFVFPPPIGAAGTVVPEKITATYSGGTFVTTVRAILP